MVLPVGALVNGGAIIAGAVLGMLAGSVIPERLRASLFQVLGLCTFFLGIKMALGVSDLMLIIISCVLGISTGEMMKLGDCFENCGDRLKGWLKSDNDKFTEGLVTASVLYCVGAMAIVGAFEEGLGGRPTTLLNKSILDFCMSMMLASVSGSGVLWSFVPVLLYEAGLTLMAGALKPFMTQPIENALVSVGGLMVMGIGANLMGIKSIAISNLLPALFYAVVLAAFFG